MFSTESAYTFTETNTDDLNPVQLTEDSSQSFTDTDNEAYYFHVAAVNDIGDISTTTSLGPFLVDVVAPSSVSVAAPEMSSVLGISLTLEATGATEIFISNIEYEGNDGEWETLVASKEWELTEGIGEKTIYVSFRDEAGNTADASTTTKVIMAGDVDSGGTVDLKDAILALMVITGQNRPQGITVSSGADVNNDKKIGMEEVLFILNSLI